MSCENPVGAQPGDRVRIDAGPEPEGWLAWVALAYALPVLLLLAGAVLGDALAASLSFVDLWRRDAVSAAGALSGLIGGLVTGRYASRMLISAKEGSETARIVAILPVTRSD